MRFGEWFVGRRGEEMGGVSVVVDRESSGELLNAPDGVASSEANPLRHRAVLLLGLGKLLLGTERLVAL